MLNIIFDFDGTLADSFDLIVQIFYSMTKRAEPLSSKEMDRLRELPLRRIFQEVGVKMWRVPYLYRKGKSMMAKHINELNLIPEIEETLDKLREDNKLFIISSNSASNINQFLKLKRIDKYFTGVMGGAGITGKKRVINKMIRRYKLDRRNSFYVGDETRDIEAAHKSHVKSIAVTWGFSPEKTLKKVKPYAIANKPQDIAGITRTFVAKAK
ncbi:MAG TPA: HAD hydrolase-like protein [Candidatus Saccharimonadales bacterium]|nr:HAD hydrolase-like protein [Candidatus Saccharimonadales bacterium]